MKKVLSLIVLDHIVATLPVVQAQTATEEPLTPAECSAEKYFSDNQCQVCYTANEEAKSDTKGFLLPASDIPWENTLDGINQNFYKSSQSVPEIKTNLGTAPATWDEKGLTWSTDVVWKDLDGLEMFSLDAGKTINIKSIEKDTLLPVNSIKDATSPYLVLKLPISYYELKMGTFKESAKKTTNYCISYTTKKVAGTTTSTNTATTNTNTTTSNNTTTSTNPTTQNTTTNTNTATASNTNTTTNNTTTNTISNNTSTTNSDTADTSTVATEDTADATTTTINDEIPSYDAKVALNSAGTDPTASEASKIQTGPAENMLVLMAAILLSLALFPKINTLLNK
mgnify:FL=1